MIGKIYFKNEWKICRFEKNNLEILCASCDAPWRLENKNFNPAEFTVAEFEDGYFYFFDLNGGLAKVSGEYVQYRLQISSFFKSFEPFLQDGFDLEGFESVAFKNGVLMPMVTLSKTPKFDIEIENLIVKTEFRLNEVLDDFLCATEQGAMLSNYPTKKMDYELVATFPRAIDLPMLNKITKKLYRIIQFISTDYNAPIESIIVKTNIGDLIYCHNDICLTSEPVIKRFNYIGNCSEEIKEIAQNLVRDKCDVSFLSLIGKEDLIDRDYWVLGQSLETNVPDNVGKKFQNSELKNEINIYENLRKEIEKTIKVFEKQNAESAGILDDFNLSLIEITRFRKKAEFVFEKYNNFANNYGKYTKFDFAELNEFSDLLSKARNTVHNSQNMPADKEKVEFIAALCVVGLYIYILEKSGAPSSCIFNLIQCFYP